MAAEPSKRPFEARPRQFSQERSRRTYEALITAAEAVFSERGFDATQTPDIASRAQVSVGSFYRYFSDKREAFLEVLRRHLEVAHTNVMAELSPERFVGAGRRQTIEIAINVLLDHVRKFPGLQRTFMEMSLRDEMVAQLRARFEEVGREQLANLIAVVCPREVVADPDATAYVIQTSVVECAIVMTGVRGEPAIAPDRAMVALTDLVFRALFGNSD